MMSVCLYLSVLFTVQGHETAIGKLSFDRWLVQRTIELDDSIGRWNLVWFVSQDCQGKRGRKFWMWIFAFESAPCTRDWRECFRSNVRLRRANLLIELYIWEMSCSTESSTTVCAEMEDPAFFFFVFFTFVLLAGPSNDRVVVCTSFCAMFTHRKYCRESRSCYALDALFSFAFSEIRLCLRGFPGSRERRDGLPLSRSLSLSHTPFSLSFCLFSLGSLSVHRRAGFLLWTMIFIVSPVFCFVGRGSCGSRLSVADPSESLRNGYRKKPYKKSRYST